MSQSESIANLAAAVVAVQGELRGYVEDSDNPFFSSKYGDLTSVWAAIREPLTKHGLAVVQTCDVCNDPPLELIGKKGEVTHAIPVIVITTLIHSSGEWISGRCKMQPTREGPQGTGSAITYARRYGLAGIIGIAPADDDGEGATNRASTSRASKQQAAGRRADTESTPATPLGEYWRRWELVGSKEEWQRVLAVAGITKENRGDEQKWNLVLVELIALEKLAFSKADSAGGYNG